jgi:hypothetical protein
VSITICWDSDEQDILYFAIKGGWSWLDLQQQIDSAIEFAGQPVPTIVDLRDWIGLPSSNLFLPDNLTQAKVLMARNVRRKTPIIVVGADADARMLYDCLRMMDSRVGWQVYFTETLDEARDFLHESQHSKRPAC